MFFFFTSAWINIKIAMVNSIQFNRSLITFLWNLILKWHWPSNKKPQNWIPFYSCNKLITNAFSLGRNIFYFHFVPQDEQTKWIQANRSKYECTFNWLMVRIAIKKWATNSILKSILTFKLQSPEPNIHTKKRNICPVAGCNFQLWQYLNTQFS